MDGFDQTTNVKVIMATNRADTLDPALLCPGRLDRKIEFPQPDKRQKRMVFQAATAKMNLSDELDLENYVNTSEQWLPEYFTIDKSGEHSFKKGKGWIVVLTVFSIEHILMK